MRFLPAALLLFACARFPELEATQTPGVATAPYPRLVPIETLLTGQPPRATPEMRDGLEDRAEALRARAAGLGGAVVDDVTRARMRRGVSDPR